MSQQPSGWYDDPSDPDLLRYWDGISWSDHTAPRRSPTASPSAGPQPGSEQPAGSAPPGSGWQPAPSQPGWQGQASQSPQQRQQGQPGQSGQYAGAPGMTGNANWMHDLPTTADGVELASWGRRFGAWLIDGAILLVVSVFISRVIAPEVWTEVGRAMDVMIQQGPNPDQAVIDEATRQMSVVVAAAAPKLGIAQFLMVAVYCIGFWTTTAQTPGKMVVGISVRRVDRPGPLDIMTAVRRRMISLVQLLPFVSFLSFIIIPLDGLWPLWDAKRQTLHDKIALTQVVMGKQPKKDAATRP